eukprot:TRINITY_DN262_c0_g1_i2.p1 TRINITY_DN262_c0_g1~~TRINITY_DN262_c0_g1_i2.p1  ORF type:complete len:138 (-),score=29.33 TRINITY_DN262_c0_g1_i2:282-695(-)
MASLALTAASSTAASRFCGQKLSIKSAVKSSKASIRLPAVRAKYGDESVYFDLKDIGNTTGSWDLYGSDGPSPYNGLQAKFFETFAGAFTKRGILLKFLVLGGAGAIGYVSSNASADLLPIAKGPQEPSKPGPRDRL